MSDPRKPSKCNFVSLSFDGRIVFGIHGMIVLPDRETGSPSLKLLSVAEIHGKPAACIRGKPLILNNKRVSYFYLTIFPCPL